MAEKKKSRISPIFKRAISHIFTKPATTKYPFVHPQLPEDARCKTVYAIESCNIIDIGTGLKEGLTLDVRSIVGSNCRICVRDCPAGAIEIVEAEGKKRPQIRFDRCIFCHQCVESCPRGAIKSSIFYELATTDKCSLIQTPKETKLQ